MPSPLLSLDSINIAYGKIHVLHNISLKVFPGEIITILGANGAGKTTTLYTISGLLKPFSGKIVFEDKEIQNLPGYAVVNKGISLSPEGRRVFGTMTVQENLELGAYSNKGKDHKQTLEWIYSLFPRLKERLKQLSGTLSGGEQQMLAIGRALMAKPKVLLLDEPSLGLAPMLVKSIFQTVKEINESGVTIVLVEQNAKSALKLANRAYVLETGNIKLEGSAKDLLHDPAIQKAYLGEEAS